MDNDERNLQMTDTQLQRPQHPAFLAETERRSAKLQLRVADTITAFAGSMRFVYLHAWVFAIWMLTTPRYSVVWPADSPPRVSSSSCPPGRPVAVDPDQPTLLAVTTDS